MTILEVIEKTNREYLLKEVPAIIRNFMEPVISAKLMTMEKGGLKYVGRGFGFQLTPKPDSITTWSLWSDTKERIINKDIDGSWFISTGDLEFVPEMVPLNEESFAKVLESILL